MDQGGTPEDGRVTEAFSKSIGEPFKMFDRCARSIGFASWRLVKWLIKSIG